MHHERLHAHYFLGIFSGWLRRERERKAAIVDMVKSQAWSWRGLPRELWGKATWLIIVCIRFDLRIWGNLDCKNKYLFENKYHLADEMALQGKAASTCCQAWHPNSISQQAWWEKRTSYCKLSYDSHSYSVAHMCMCTSIHTQAHAHVHTHSNVKRISVMVIAYKTAPSYRMRVF